MHIGKAIPGYAPSAAGRLRYMQLIRPALRTSRLYPQAIFLVLRLSQSQGNSVTGRIMSVNNPNDPIGNRTRDLPFCSAVPQPTAQSPSNVYRPLQYERERIGLVWFRLGIWKLRCRGRRFAGKETAPCVAKKKGDTHVAEM